MCLFLLVGDLIIVMVAFYMIGSDIKVKCQYLKKSKPTTNPDSESQSTVPETRREKIDEPFFKIWKDLSQRMKIYGRRESMISLQHKGKAPFLSVSLSSFNHFYSDKGNPEVPSLQF